MSSTTSGRIVRRTSRSETLLATLAAQVAVLGTLVLGASVVYMLASFAGLLR